MERLRYFGANPNIKDHFKSTPLHYLIRLSLEASDSYDTELSLLKEIPALDYAKITPMDIMSKKYPEGKAFGANPNLQDEYEGWN